MEQRCSVQTNTFYDSTSSYLWIVNPFGKFRKRFLTGLMDTHPTTADRMSPNSPKSCSISLITSSSMRMLTFTAFAMMYDTSSSLSNVLH